MLPQPAASLTLDLSSRFRQPLMRFFLRRTDSRADAEDLTQEVFVRILTLRDAGAVQSLDAFIFTVAANLMRDRWRQRATQTVVRSIEDLGPSEGGPAQADERSPDRVLQAREGVAAIMRRLDRLSSRTRDIFILHRIENMRQKDIAQAFGLSVSAVEKHVSRALLCLSGLDVRDE
ncbi:MAG TPA: RNA polymerase sigma factor [Ramlibacter sp.]|nr:RNA polymerase sigma factor [Ramlibacter sp.]